MAAHEIVRRHALNRIHEENLKLAQRLSSVKASYDGKNLKKHYTHHLKTKSLRCKLPIVAQSQQNPLHNEESNLFGASDKSRSHLRGHTELSNITSLQKYRELPYLN